MAEARKVHALDRAAPQTREALRMVRRDEAVGLAHEDEQRHAKPRRTRPEDVLRPAAESQYGRVRFGRIVTVGKNYLVLNGGLADLFRFFQQFRL